MYFEHSSILLNFCYLVYALSVSLAKIQRFNFGLYQSRLQFRFESSRWNLLSIRYLQNSCEVQLFWNIWIFTFEIKASFVLYSSLRFLLSVPCVSIEVSTAFNHILKFLNTFNATGIWLWFFRHSSINYSSNYSNITWPHSSFTLCPNSRHQVPQPTQVQFMLAIKGKFP